LIKSGVEKGKGLVVVVGLQEKFRVLFHNYMKWQQYCSNEFVMWQLVGWMLEANCGAQLLLLLLLSLSLSLDECYALSLSLYR
jgi:hypothetical protein